MIFTEENLIDVMKDMDLPGRDLVTLDPARNLSEQGFDSLDMMDLYFRIEEKIGKKIDFENGEITMDDWKTIEGILQGISHL